MKAISISRFGGPEELRFVEMDDPVPEAGQIAIRVEASGVNLGDAVIRSGKSGLTLPLPYVPGSEVAGTVAAIGAGVKEFAVGDRVLGAIFAEPRLDGGYAQMAAVSADVIFPLPEGVPFEAGVTLAVQGLTADQLIADSPVTGKRVLVHAAAGGVGQLLIRLARNARAEHIVGIVSSAAKAQAALSAGADQVAVSSDENWPSKAGGAFDVIFDATGGEITAASLPLLAPMGRYAVYGGASGTYPSIAPSQMASLVAAAQSISGTSLWSVLGNPKRKRSVLREAYDRLFALVESGRLHPAIGHRLPLAQAAEAHRLIESRASTGKIVLFP